MKCSLCEGKGFFYTGKRNKEIEKYVGSSEYNVKRICPKCKGSKKEEPMVRRDRVKVLLKYYGKYYSKVFKSKKDYPEKMMIKKSLRNNILF